jgi:hypothetical protein
MAQKVADAINKAQAGAIIEPVRSLQLFVA